MSLLNSAPLAPQDAETIRTTVNPVIAAYLREHFGIDDPQEAISEWAAQLGAGRTLASTLDLRPEHIDALLSQARDLIRAGQLARARDKLMLVLFLDPLEVRAVYAAAATLQMEQRYAEAGRLYASYIVLEPLAAVGYLRMGECLLGNAEPDEAREFIASALSLAREQEDVATAEHAEKLLSFIDTNRAAIRVRGASAP
ncbi:hypothetical protein ACUSIJ_07560 [Pseudochelatococcus sp. B33]